jgi:dynein heavy chain
VLKGVDEVNLLLEDMGLNLQSMMASPHVRPFAEDVRNWEQRLSLIGEAIEVGPGSAQAQVSVGSALACKACLQQSFYGICYHTHHMSPATDATSLATGAVVQVWMLVQRKWMYLESIFIGSDDIRNQLPQEAKRFDTIDKAWLKIMADTAKNTNVLETCSADGRCDRAYVWRVLYMYCQVFKGHQAACVVQGV